MYKMAIVGCGATSVAFIYNFIQKYMQTSRKPLAITIFEKSEYLGVGIPYNDDFLSVRLNQTIDHVSISIGDPLHFQKWLKKQKKYSFFSDKQYIPRMIYGKYLQWSLQQVMSQAVEHIKVCTILEEVIDIHLNLEDNLIIETFNNSYQFDMVLLCTGHIFKKDPYHLLKYPHYIDKPYPLIKKLPLIKKNQSVAILGSGLTAVDIAISLQEENHIGPIHMISRHGQLPFVQPDNKNLTPIVIRTDAFKDIKNYSLDTLLYTLKQELKFNNINWDKLISRNMLAEEYYSFKRKLEESENETKMYYDACMEMVYFIDGIWGELGDYDKEKFNQEILPLLLLRAASMPFDTAKIILDMMQKNLKVKTGLEFFEYRSNKFIVNFKNQEKMMYDWIFNSTGLSRNINDSDSLLIYNLIQKGVVTSHPLGGIKINPKSGSVISKDNNVHSNIKVIGHIASGNYFIINNMKFLLSAINSVIKDILKHLQTFEKGYNGQ